MKKTAVAGCGIVCAIALVIVMAPTGCEKGRATGSLTVTPAYVSMWGASNTVTFSVVFGTNEFGGEFAGELYDWWVEDEDLGAIHHSSGDQALYVRTSVTGENYIYVSDAYYREGWAVVEQY